jgi:hypothetical protein
MPHHHPLPGRRQVIAQVIVGAVILVSGIAIGGGGTILALKDRILPVIDGPQPPGGNTPDANGRDPSKPSRWIADKWRTDYGLDEKQTQQARETLAKEFATTERLREEFRKAEQAQREKFVLAVKAILTSEQFAKWEPDFTRMVQHMENMRPFDPRRGGRGGPRPDWRPDRRMDPNDRRGGWQPGPPRDPNSPRGDWSRDRFRDSDGRRGDWERDRPRDPNDQHGPRPPERFMDTNDRPADLGQPK